MARSIDHLVLPVADLSESRQRFEALGFTVAPDALHPFGTANACVFFGDGTYLEPLAVDVPEKYVESAKNGNPFTARDITFRHHNGSEGLSALVMKTDDASADDARFRTLGYSSGEMLEFSRPFQSPNGNVGTASFRLAFATDVRSPDFFGFCCERLNMPASDRTALERHENGTIGLAEIVLAEREPADFSDYVAALTDTAAEDDRDGGLIYRTGNARVRVLTPATFASEFGLELSRERGLKGVAVVFAVKNLAELAHVLEGNAVDHKTIGNRIIVDHKPGQGTMMVFSE